MLFQLVAYALVMRGVRGWDLCLALLTFTCVHDGLSYIHLLVFYLVTVTCSYM